MMKKAFTIFIGFVHDFAAGCWLASVLAVFWLDRVAMSNLQLKPLLDGLESQFFWVGVVSFILVFVAGAGRTFTYAYIGSVYGEQSEQLRRRMLMVKHVFLLSVFGLGTWWQYTLAFN